jgi:hypothetical protein
VREESRPDAREEAGLLRSPDVDDRDPVGFRSERRPEKATRWVDRDVPGRAAELDPPDDPAAHDVHDDKAAEAGVRDIRVTTLGRAGCVPRLGETSEHASDRQCPAVDDGERALSSVRDDGSVADSLDAPRAWECSDSGEATAVLQVDGDDARLEVSRDERDRRAAERARKGIRRQDECRGGAKEPAAIHAFRTADAGKEVQSATG